MSLSAATRSELKGAAGYVRVSFVEHHNCPLGLVGDQPFNVGLGVKRAGGLLGFVT